MGKRNLGGNLTRHAADNARGGGGPRCIACGVVIFYGERCPACDRDLRQRQRQRKRRKPR
jgi:hypothetical protein